MSSRHLIHIEGCERALPCDAEERVLTAIERGAGFGLLRGAPVKVPVGCRRGGCGVCRVEVIRGEFHKGAMSRAHVSEPEERAGFALACSIYPRSELFLRPAPRAARAAEPGSAGRHR